MSSLTYRRRLAILSFLEIFVPSDPAWETWFYIPEGIQNHWNIIGVPDLMRGLSDPESLPDRSSLCTWDELRRLEEGGISVEPHGMTHRAFSSLWPAEQLAESEGSNAVLEEGLQTPVSMFAFPFGDGADPAMVLRC